jgi:hypothetical protein
MTNAGRGAWVAALVGIALAAGLGPRAQEPNGISVGRPKVFDNRTLTLMLEALSEQLRTIQTVDQKTLAAAFGLLQGFQSRESSSSLTVSGLPTPSTTNEVETKTGNVSQAGAALPDTSTTKTSNTVGSVTPQIPTLDAASPTIPGFNPEYGQSPGDLLSDQVNLSYQIFNLRMILERSLSDRLLASGNPASDNTTRLQAVLGFNVTIDPPRTAEEAVAVVEVTLEPADSPLVGYSPSTPGVQSMSAAQSAIDDSLSLVALMPQEKTYNSAAVSTKSSAFGGAAVAGMVHVGYNQRRRGQTFYLYRDADTVAYERMRPQGARDLKFGWMFRPVLGQKAVSPGMRQLFAIVSVPRRDVNADDLAQILNARVRTYWKKYDANTRTSFEERDANFAARMRYWLSGTLAKPEIFETRYENGAMYSSIQVRPTALYQNGLRPTVSNVRWQSVGPKTVVVSVEGNNFFTGTQVSIGGKTYVGNGDGLVLKSNQALDLTAPLDVLETGSGVISGRYGAAVSMAVNPSSVPALAALSRPTIVSLNLGASLGQHRELHACFNNLPPEMPVAATRTDMVLTVNGAVVPPPYAYAANCVTALVPADLLKELKGQIRFTWPFIAGWTTSQRLYDPAEAFRVARLDKTRILITNQSAAGFKYEREAGGPELCWTLHTGGPSYPFKRTECPSGSDKTHALTDHAMTVAVGETMPDYLILENPVHGIVTLQVPQQEKPEKPRLTEINQFDSVWIDIPVDDAAEIDAVDANQVRLQKRPGKAKPQEPSKVLQVQLTRELTSRPGLVELTLLAKDGKVLGKWTVKVVCRECLGLEGAK